MQRFFPDKAFPDLSMHCNSFKWKRCSSQAGADQKQGINDSNPMSDVSSSWSTLGTGRAWSVVMPQKLQIPLCSDVYRKTWMEYPHAALKIQYIVSKSRYHVLRFYKNNNRKHSISNACGCFEMVEATGVEPVS